MTQAPERVGLRSPFDHYPGADEENVRLNGFLRRTGLHDYERYIRIGAFLARRDPGAPQVEYVRKIRRQEEAEEAARSNSRAEGTAQQDLKDGPMENSENKKLREEYEDDILDREGHSGKRFRWHILSQQNWHVLALVGCCSLGAVIQGWDETAINGAQMYYQREEVFNIQKDTGLVGVINAAPYLMCILSCCLTGTLNHYLGRKGTIMFCCVFCFASCLGQAFCDSPKQLLGCRLLLGFGIGPKSATIPIYAAESVPSEEIRGALVMTWQLCTALGIMLGYIFTYIFQDLPDHLRWRFMVGSPIVAPAVLFFLMLALPESPRWHLLKARRLESDSDTNRLRMNRLRIVDQYDKAFHALRRLRYLKLQAARDLYTIDIWLRMDPPQHSHGPEEYLAGGDLKYQLKTWFPNIIILFKDSRCLRAMMSGLIVLSLQQLCGVNVFAYYSSSVVRDSLPDRPDFGNQTLRTIIDAEKDHMALGYSLGFGGINFGLAIVGLFLIDSVGRRLLLVLTFPLMSLFQFGTAFSFGKITPVTDSRRHPPVVLFTYLFCAVYSIGEGPVPFVYASEILPLEVRDTGVGLLTGIYWGLNSLMALTWPPMYHKLNPEGSFCFYGGLNLIGWVLVILFVPETSRYKLEEVDTVFRFKTGKIMDNGLDQMKWLLGKKGSGSRRWQLKEFPVLVPRSNDKSSGIQRELNDVKASSRNSASINDDSEATNGHLTSPGDGSAKQRTHRIRDV